MIDKLIIAATACVELSNILLCYAKILCIDLDTKRERIIAVFAGIAMLGFFNSCIGFPVVSAHLNIAYCVVILLLLAKDKRVKVVLLYPSAYVISSIVNVAASFVVANILGQSQVQVSENPYYALLLDSIFSVAILLLIYLQHKKIVPRYDGIFVNNSVYVVLSGGAFIVFLLICVLMYAGEFSLLPQKTANFLGLFASVIGIIFFVICYWLSYTIYQNAVIQKEKTLFDMQLESQERYIDLILKKDLEIRKFRHDVREHINIISYHLQKQEYQQAEIYLRELESGYENAVLKKYTGITAIDAILTDKEENMKEKGIDFRSEIVLPSLPERFSQFDVCTLIINLINNAIEACEKLPQEEKQVCFRLGYEGPHLYLAESNPCHTPVRFTKDGCPITNKSGENHGLGSRNVQTVVQKYDGELEYTVEDDSFRVEIIL